ncbi:hypothetical protein [Pedobacter sp. MR22-3]|jgi:hypothetical protein|uniref:hypothetical protein n=1 Tax=Pedobacter sp. MR22-3 TaxID=2994552 RepID=UPI0022463C63|nr:hypothetical protein [Pedobacter sp. MR22-3]MCX2582718.1 hypothetical protein [Pedobacter sp. MR22-3]
MNKMFNIKSIAVAVVLSLTSIVGFSAFTANPVSKENKRVNYYWYDPQTGNLLSETPSEVSPNGCPDEGSIECARGFLAPTDQPTTDTPDRIVMKPTL